MNPQLVEELESYNYYPRAAANALDLALGGEAAESILVQRSTVIDDEAVRRHLNALVLTSTRLVMLHIDEADDANNVILVGTDAVPLLAISAVRIAHGIADPEAVDGGRIVEVTLSIGWQGTRQLDIQAKSCGDPECNADHGLGGVLMNEDLMVRVTVDADGWEQVQRTSQFAARLAEATARAR